MKEGDKNTRFFHIMANAHRRRNTLLNISINGRRLVKDTKIKEGLVDAFQNLLSSPNSWRPPLLDLPFIEISDVQATKLEEMFTEKEILATVSGLSGDKAPCPNGFPLAFWAYSWDFVKDEVLGLFKIYQFSGRPLQDLNQSFGQHNQKGHEFDHLPSSECLCRKKTDPRRSLNSQRGSGLDFEEEREWVAL